MSPAAKSALWAINDYGPVVRVALTRAGHSNLGNILISLIADGYISRETQTAKASYLYSITKAGKRVLMRPVGTVAPPQTYVPSGLYVPAPWQVARPGAMAAFDVQSAGVPT